MISSRLILTTQGILEEARKVHLMKGITESKGRLTKVSFLFRMQDDLKKNESPKHESPPKHDSPNTEHNVSYSHSDLPFSRPKRR